MYLYPNDCGNIKSSPDERSSAPFIEAASDWASRLKQSPEMQIHTVRREKA